MSQFPNLSTPFGQGVNFYFKKFQKNHFFEKYENFQLIPYKQHLVG